jgi:hypothetical protein
MTSPDPTLLIDDLYAGALDDAAWTRASIAVGDYVGATGVHIFAFNPASNVVTRHESHRIDPRSAVAYQDYYFNKDILVKPFERIAVVEPTPEHRLVTLDAWHRSEIYNELAVPYDTPYLLTTLLHRAPDKLVALSLKTSARHGPFRADEADQLRRFIPSIRHVIEIKDRLAALQVRADSLAESLDSLSFGVVVLDAMGRVIESNAFADGILAARDSGVNINSQRQVDVREPTGKALYRWIITGTPPDQHFDGLFHVSRASKLPISLLVSPYHTKQSLGSPGIRGGFSCSLIRNTAFWYRLVWFRGTLESP